MSHTLNGMLAWLKALVPGITPPWIDLVVADRQNEQGVIFRTQTYYSPMAANTTPVAHHRFYPYVGDVHSSPHMSNRQSLLP